jgi:hypothetical protein
MSHGFRLAIEFMIIGGFIDPESITDQARMVPFLQNQDAWYEILKIGPPSLSFPIYCQPGTSSMTSKPILIAFIEEGFIVGVVGGPHDGAAELLF